MSNNLEKLKLEAWNGEAPDIEMMFNPASLDFQLKSAYTEDQGARTDDEGIPKVSFAYPNAIVVNIKDIIYDTYEMGQSVRPYIEKLNKATKFIEGTDPKRPPAYTLGWGTNKFLFCFVESVNYQMTQFLPNGTPVRAKVSLTLKQVDPTALTQGGPAVQPNRQGNGRDDI